MDQNINSLKSILLLLITDNKSINQSMNKNIHQIIWLKRIRVVITTIICCYSFSQQVSGQRVKLATRTLDFNGDGREDIINVQQISGKMTTEFIFTGQISG